MNRRRGWIVLAATSLAWTTLTVVACSSGAPALATTADTAADGSATVEEGASDLETTGDVGVSANDSSVEDGGGAAPDASDAAASEGVATVTGSVGGVTLSPAYAYSEVISGDLFVIISTSADACGGPGTNELALQTLGGSGASGTYQTGTSLLVSLFPNAGTCGAGFLVGAGSVVVTSTPPVVEGTFTTSFDGGTFAGSFTAPHGTGCDHLSVCDGG